MCALQPELNADDERLYELAEDLALELAALVEERGGDSLALLSWEQFGRRWDDACRCGHARSSHQSTVTRCTVCECTQFDGTDNR